MTPRPQSRGPVKELYAGIVRRHSALWEGGAGSTRWGDRVPMTPEERRARRAESRAGGDSADGGLAKMLSGSHPAVTKTISEHIPHLWERTVSSGKENCVVVSGDGGKTLEREGGPHNIRFSDAEVDAMQHQHLVHTHPSEARNGVPAPLSSDDLIFAVMENLSSISATTESGSFVLIRPKEGWFGGEGRNRFPVEHRMTRPTRAGGMETKTSVSARVIAGIPADHRKTLEVRLALRTEVRTVVKANQVFYESELVRYQGLLASGALKRHPKAASDAAYANSLASRSAFNDGIRKICEHHDWEMKFIPTKGKKAPDWFRPSEKGANKKLKISRTYHQKVFGL